MARCDCGGGQCNCTLVPGPGITIDGSGSTANPAIISAVPLDCADVRPCISAGDGAAYDEATGVISARPSTVAGNTLVISPGDGGLLVLPAEVTCDEVRPCISAGDGAAYDPATGVVSARPSTTAGNNLAIDPGDGGLFVPTGAATVTTGCGLTGDGSGGAPVAAAVGTWPFACDPATYGGGVYCDTAGVLRTDPRSTAAYTQDVVTVDNPNTLVPTTSPPATVETRTLTIVNNDPCREAFVIMEIELDIDLILPPSAGASYGVAGDEMYYMWNSGSSTMSDVHTQVTKVYHRTIPAGGTLVEPIGIAIGRGSGGAQYNKIQSFMRCFRFNL